MLSLFTIAHHGTHDSSTADSVRSVANIPGLTRPLQRVSTFQARRNTVLWAIFLAIPIAPLYLRMIKLMKNSCVVGGNSVSAFLSWRLSATNACDVTLVWKSGYENVAQYGISFRYYT